MSSFGAIDLFSGNTSITGTNLWQVNKNPLNTIDAGIEDVIGKQGKNAGGQVTQIVDELVNSILGFPLLGPPQGGPNDIYTFFGNLLGFLGGLDPLNLNFDIPTSAQNFVNDILHPTNLLAPLVTNPFQGLGLVGVVPLENLAIDAILAGVGSIQDLIDAILKTVWPGYVPGSGLVDDVFNYFTDLLKMFTHMDVTDPNWWLDLASGAFDPAAATVQFIMSVLLPAQNPLDPLGLTHLLAPLVPIGSAGLNFPVVGHVPMANLAVDLISDAVGAIIGNAQEIIDAILSSLAAIPGFPVFAPGTGVPADITDYFTDIVKILGLPPLTTPAGALHLIPWGKVTGIWGITTIGDTAQQITDSIVHGIVNPPSGIAPPTGMNLGDLRTQLAAQSKYLGFIDPGYQPPGAQPPVDSIGAMTQQHEDHLKQASGARPVFAGIDQSADPVFDFSTLVGVVIPTVPVTLNNSAIGMIGTPNVANKKSIEFYGGNTANLTALYINLYAVDSTPKDQGGSGNTTWLHSSNNIVSALRDLSGTEKDAIEARVSSGMAWNYYNFPSGSIQTVSLGLPVQLPGAGTFKLTFKGYTTAAISYAADRSVVQTALQNLPSIGVGNVYVYGARSPAGWGVGGPWTVCFRGTLANAVQPPMTFVKPTALPPGAMPEVYDGLLTGQGAYYAVEMVVMGSGQYDIGGMHHAALPHENAFPKHFGAKRSGSLTQPPPATITPDYSPTAVPWFGLCGEPGKTQYTPTLTTFYQSGSFDPKQYPWASYFDVAVCGGGGGGCAGFLAAGAASGRAGGWNGRVLTKAQAGTSNWSINVGSGGLGGKITATVGSQGYPSSVSIAGQSTITASYGTGGSGNSGDLNGAAGQNAPNYVLRDANGNDQTYYGGAGGATPNADGSAPGGGGAGGNATSLLHDQFGGNGGAGVVYIWAYM